MVYDFQSVEGTAGQQTTTRDRRGRKPRSQRGLHPRQGKKERKAARAKAKANAEVYCSIVSNNRDRWVLCTDPECEREILPRSIAASWRVCCDRCTQTNSEEHDDLCDNYICLEGGVRVV